MKKQISLLRNELHYSRTLFIFKLKSTGNANVLLSF